MAEMKNEFSWSKSRAETFSACPRQYFYRYYGSWGGWDRKADPKTRTTYILKQLQTRQQWAGATVHNGLRWVLTTLRDTGAAPAEETTLNALGKRLALDFQNSGEGLYWDEPKKMCGLIEHEYDDLEVSDEVWSALFERALASISTFYHSEVFEKLKTLPADQWVEVEKLGSFDVDGLKVWVQLDCAFWAESNLHIIDWKTGRTDVDSTKIQLALYTWYASKQWNVAPENIVPGEFNLGTNELFTHPFTANDFQSVHERIAKSVAAMRELLDDAVANAATEENFPLAETNTPCASCAFRRICPRWATPIEAME